VEPMFPPVHEVPIYVAGYRTPMLELAGRKGEGYLARPLESLPSFMRMVPRIRRASVDAGRPENAVRIAGYLFGLGDASRREALNRAKREPFVIYMMAIQTEVALRRAGLPLDSGTGSLACGGPSSITRPPSSSPTRCSTPSSSAGPARR
jgi:alkanesulfonate monooxygenase SsuD/methylene tetrahydromethanopterin reductase-like flavin-dependent oxidoreductase (luciferase family)